MTGNAGCAAPPPRVLFYLNHPSAAVEYLLVADALQGDAEVTILSATAASARGIPADRRGDHRVVDWSGQPVDWSRVEAAWRAASGAKPATGWRRGLARLAAAPVLGLPAQTALATVRLVRSRRAAGRLLDRERPDVLVVVGDRRLFTDTPILVEARSRGIGSVMVPFADGSPHTLVDYRAGMAELKVGRAPHRLAKRIAAKLAPSHVHATPAGPILFYAAADTIAMRLVGCSPRMPWILGASGWIDAVGVLGHVDKGYYRDYGLTADHVHVVSQPSLDRLHAARSARPDLRAGLDARYGFDPARPLIICSLPQAWTEVESWSPANYRDLHDTLVACGANILYSLHPKMRREDYADLDEGPRMRFSAARLVDDLPAADVYVASYSSTMRWSTMLRLPAMIVDFPVYPEGRPPNPYPFLPIATDAAALAAWLGRILTDPQFRAETVSNLDAVTRASGPHDGKAGRRLADLVLDVAAARDRRGWPPPGQRHLPPAAGSAAPRTDP